MSSFVLDASTLLALLNKEEGWEIVESHLSHSVISAINLSEVAAVLNNIGMPSYVHKQPFYRTCFHVTHFCFFYILHRAQ